ncbi:hypothetical protein ALQ56_200135 [Pseudomonas syringae pv. papulans]|nr:hypothetical protein ALQ56_200135 [Pseudomonas syringae pv. papulans]
MVHTINRNDFGSLRAPAVNLILPRHLEGGLDTFTSTHDEKRMDKSGLHQFATDSLGKRFGEYRI